MTLKLFPFTFILLFVIIGCSKTTKNVSRRIETTASGIKATVSKIDRAYFSMLGHYSNKKQADTATSPYCKGQVLKSIPIWQSEGRKHWLIMGWFSDMDPDVPLAAGIFHLKKYEKDTFILDFFDFPDDLDLKSIWKKTSLLNKYSPKDLILANGCGSYLADIGEDKFQVVNDKKPCSKNISDHMKYFDMEATFSPTRQVHANVFFDSAKKISMIYPKIFYERF